MRYTKNHKAATRQRILRSARELFMAQGFNATTIEQIMSTCNLTRGGFYAHFQGKSELYHEAMTIAPSDTTGKTGRLDELVEEYLAGDGKLGVLVNDLGLNKSELEDTYTHYFTALLQQWRCSNSDWDEDTLLSTAAMLVGASAIAKSTNETQLKVKLINACRAKGNILASKFPPSSTQSVFWDPSV